MFRFMATEFKAVGKQNMKAEACGRRKLLMGWVAGHVKMDSLG